MSEITHTLKVLIEGWFTTVLTGPDFPDDLMNWSVSFSVANFPSFTLARAAA